MQGSKFFKRDTLNQVGIFAIIILVIICLLEGDLSFLSVIVFAILGVLFIINIDKIKADTKTLILACAIMVLGAASVLASGGAPGSVFIVWNITLGLTTLRWLRMGVVNKIFLLMVVGFFFIYYAQLSFVVRPAFLSGLTDMNPNTVATRVFFCYILMSVAFFWKNKISKTLLFLLGLFTIFCAYKCDCRTIMMLTSLHIVLSYIPLVYKIISKFYKPLLALIVILGAIIPIIYVAAWRQDANFTFSIGGGNGREAIWSSLFDNLSDNPEQIIFGAGTLTELSINGQKVGSHNWYLGMVYTFGLIVTILFFTFFLNTIGNFQGPHAVVSCIIFCCIGITESMFFLLTMQLIMFLIILCFDPVPAIQKAKNTSSFDRRRSK